MSNPIFFCTYKIEIQQVVDNKTKEHTQTLQMKVYSGQKRQSNFDKGMENNKHFIRIILKH